MEIHLTLPEKTSFKLTPEQGNQIREAIMQQIDVSFTYYIEKVVMMHRTNVTSILSGNRVTSIDNLRKILSGTRIEVTQCTTSITLENISGGIVPTADSVTLEEMLSYQEDNGLDHTDPQDSQDPSLESEKPQGKLRTLLDSPLWENPEESSE